MCSNVAEPNRKGIKYAYSLNRCVNSYPSKGLFLLPTDLAAANANDTLGNSSNNEGITDAEVAKMFPISPRLTIFEYLKSLFRSFLL